MRCFRFMSTASLKRGPLAPPPHIPKIVGTFFSPKNCILHFFVKCHCWCVQKFNLHLPPAADPGEGSWPLSKYFYNISRKIYFCTYSCTLMPHIDRQPRDIRVDELGTNVWAYIHLGCHPKCSEKQVCRGSISGGRDGNPPRGQNFGQK